MNGPRDQFFSCSGFAQNQHGRIYRRHFCDLREYLAQRWRGPNDFLKHRRMIDVLAQRQVFFSDSLFRLLAFFNVGSRCIPAQDLSLFVP